MKEAIEMKPVIDLMGATKKTLNNMVSYFEQARDDANDKQIKPEKYWAYIMQNVKAEAKITAEDLLSAGLSTPMLVECLDLDEADAKPQTLTYKNLILTMKDKTTKSLPLNQVTPKVAPFAKNFKSPMEAIIMGDPEAILKVFQHIYGKEVVQWSIPAEESIVMPQLAAACLVELYNLLKFDKASEIFEVQEKKIVVKKDIEKGLQDAFDKKDKVYLLNLFPNVLQDYPEILLQETQTVLNLLSKEEIDKRFPGINQEYLVNLKEDQKKELVVRLEGFLKPVEITKAGGKVSMAGKEKKAKKVHEGRPDPDGGPIPEMDGHTLFIKAIEATDILSLDGEEYLVAIVTKLLGYDDVEEFFRDNPGAVEAIEAWVIKHIDADSPWFERLQDIVAGEVEEEPEGDVRGGAQSYRPEDDVAPEKETPLLHKQGPDGLTR